MIWVLEVKIGNRLIRRLKLDAPEVFLGRERDCHVQLPADSVSRRHARLAPSASYVILEDLGSTNGTYQRDKRITRAMLNDGDTVYLGPYACAVRRADDEPDLQGVTAVPAGHDEPGARTGILDEEVRRRVQAASAPLDETAFDPKRKSPLI